MPKIIAYSFELCNSAFELERTVQTLIESGFEPFGSPVILYSPEDGLIVAQPCVQYATEPQPDPVQK